MNGKILAGSIVVVAFIAGAAMYYLQVYGYYDRISAEDAAIRFSSSPDAVPVAEFEGIDAGSSPLRFRACFVLPEVPDDAVPYPDPQPLIAPGWFSCFDAAAIGAALERGEAQAFLGQRNVADGVDRVIAVFPDGRAFAWHQLNDTYRD